MRKMTRRIRQKTASLALFVSSCLLLACGANENVLRSGKETPMPVNAASQKDPIEHELDAMRTAGFQFIYVLRRKDGAKIDSDDRGAIKLQTVDTNRRVATNDGLAIVIGSNKQIAPKNLAALFQRFAIDSYSQPAPVDANGSSNANK
jgi:hypothetical protein